MAGSPPDACVCVLFYGTDDQCYRLAQRVLNAPMRRLATHNVEFRFGLNAVGAATRELVREAVATDFPGATVIESEENIFKYPIMRRMLYSKPMTAPATIWFDDDSCLAPDCNADTWLPRVQKLLQAHDQIGSIYTQRLGGGQADWIKNQWWYTGKPLSPYVKFVTGGWWAIRTQTLLRYDWPCAELRHRGGDVMLGELLRQQGLSIGFFRDGLWINANDEGVESKSPRRGFDEKPIGYDYKQLPAPTPRDVLLAAGSCCGRNCQNCPYDPKAVKGTTTVGK